MATPTINIEKVENGYIIYTADRRKEVCESAQKMVDTFSKEFGNMLKGLKIGDIAECRLEMNVNALSDTVPAQEQEIIKNDVSRSA